MNKSGTLTTVKGEVVMIDFLEQDGMIEYWMRGQGIAEQTGREMFTPRSREEIAAMLLSPMSLRLDGTRIVVAQTETA